MPFPWSLIVSLAGTALSGSLSAANNADTKNKTNQMYNKNAADLKSDLYQDPMSRADARSVIKQLERTMDKQTKTAESKGKILGSTPEALLAQKQINSDAAANTVSNIYAANETRKDSLRDMLRKNNMQHTSALIGINEQKNENYAKMAGNAVDAFSTIQKSQKGTGSDLLGTGSDSSGTGSDSLGTWSEAKELWG